MIKFCFYAKNDPQREPIGSTQASTIEEAIKFFSLTKMLTTEQFRELFEVKPFSFDESYSTGTKQLLKG